MTPNIPVKESKNCCTFDIQVIPRASSACIVGIQDGVLKIRVTALPVEGAANEACIKLLAKELGLKKSRMEIFSGAKSRRKTVAVKDITRDQLEKAINQILNS